MRAFRRGIIRNERIGWRRAGGSASLLKPIQSDQKEACTLSLQRLPRHPFHGALKWKPSGIPSAAIIRSQCFSQFQLSSFRRRVGTPPLRCKSLDAACFLESMETGTGRLWTDRGSRTKVLTSDRTRGRIIQGCSLCWQTMPVSVFNS